MSNGILPRNRTARYAAIGNPATARIDSAVANCFPGLELDVRALEGRFFPGLLFWVVAAPVAPVAGAIPNQAGIHLKYLDYEADPMLPERSDEPWVQKLLETYQGDTGIALSAGRWYLYWIEQGGKRIPCQDAEGNAYDGELIWRFIRCLAPDEPLKIALIQRDGPRDQPPVELEGYRRRYTGHNGVIDAAYPPGELTGAMCNPWQHDFRDCACYYWASNHPDVVLGEGDGRSLPDGQPVGATDSVLWLDWLRRDRGPAGAVGAPASRASARPAQIDHFEINHRWQDLAYVIGGREVGASYHPPKPPAARPYDSPQDMITDLRTRLAPLELTLAYQYLYALFSLKDPPPAPKPGTPAALWPTLKADLVTARQFVTLVAVSEMTHLRWANQLLWELDRAGFYPAGEHYAPVLEPLAKPIEILGVMVPALRPLDLQALDEFVRIERPGGALDTAYARCVVTLEQPIYPRSLYELAVRIDTDGTQHYTRFRDLRVVLQAYRDATGASPYLLDVRPGTREQARVALDLLAELLQDLRTAYVAEARQQYPEAQAAIDKSRLTMDRLRGEALLLAAQGIGIPFFDRP
jgi:hypothetical protein